MSKNKFLLQTCVYLFGALFVVACTATEGDFASDDVISASGYDGGGDGDDHDHDDCDSSCPGGGGGGGSGCSGGGSCNGNGGPLLEVDVEVHLLGVGLAIGLDPFCGLNLSTEIDASIKGTAKLFGDKLAEIDLDEASLDIELGNGCSCSGIDLHAIVAANVHVEVGASVNSCNSFCAIQADARVDLLCDVADIACAVAVKAEVLAGCGGCCNAPGNLIVADVGLSAAVVADLNGVIDLGNGGGSNHGVEDLLDGVLDLGGLLHLVDGNGKLIKLW